MSTMNQRRLHPMARLSWPLGHVFGTARCLQKPRETHQLRELHLRETTDTSDITDWKDDPHPDCNFEFGRQCWRFFFKNLEFESESFWRSLACDAFYNQMKRAQSGGNPQNGMIWNMECLILLQQSICMSCPVPTQRSQFCLAPKWKHVTWCRWPVYEYLSLNQNSGSVWTYLLFIYLPQWYIVGLPLFTWVNCQNSPWKLRCGIGMKKWGPHILPTVVLWTLWTLDLGKFMGPSHRCP